MEKKELKNLKRGHALRLNDGCIVCFVTIHNSRPIVSWPAMGGTSPVSAEEISYVVDDINDLSERGRRDYNGAVDGMERYWPEKTVSFKLYTEE